MSVVWFGKNSLVEFLSSGQVSCVVGLRLWEHVNTQIISRGKVSYVPLQILTVSASMCIERVIGCVRPTACAYKPVESSNLMISAGLASSKYCATPPADNPFLVSQSSVHFIGITDGEVVSLEEFGEF